jgi:serine/threonine-protein kinase
MAPDRASSDRKRKEEARWLQPVIEQFEKNRPAAFPPDLESFLPPRPSQRLVALRHLVAIDLEYRLKAGESVRVEDYLWEFSELGNDPDAVVDLIVGEFSLLRRDGQVTAENYLQRFPGLEAKLRPRLLASGIDVDSAARLSVPGQHPPAQYATMRVMPQGRDLPGPEVPSPKHVHSAGLAGPHPNLRIRLEVTAGPHKGRQFQFDQHDAFIVGRSKRAHFRLASKDLYFSRMHFLVELSPPNCRLMDLTSRNGTYVNGQRVTLSDVKHGDQIKAGHTILQVVLDELPSPEEPAPTSEAQRQPASIPHPARAASPGLPSKRPTPGRSLHPRAVKSSGAPHSCLACGHALTAPVSAGGTPAQLDSVLCQVCLSHLERHPQPITNYLLIREIGKGGMGVVYQALHVPSGTIVALKTLKPPVEVTPVESERFLREARKLSQLDHPHIIAFHDMGESNRLFYFTMDFVRGLDANQLLERDGHFPIARALRLTCQLLEALEYAHGLGFVHRDIKPQNLLVTEEAGREALKLADFGLARVYLESKLSGLTLTGESGGTAGYMSPEQITNFREAKPASDQYSVGATLYRLLTGEFIYDFPPGPDQQILMILEDEPVPIRERRADIPVSLARIIHKCLAKEPKDRFPDVGALLKALVKAHS